MNADEVQDAIDHVSSPLTWMFMGAMSGVFLGESRVATMLFVVLLVLAVISIAITARRYARQRGVL